MKKIKVLEEDLVLTQQAEATARKRGMRKDAKYDYLDEITAQLTREITDTFDLTIPGQEIAWNELTDVLGSIGVDIARNSPYERIINNMKYVERRLIEWHRGLNKRRT